jgi:hypothetical protein
MGRRKPLVVDTEDDRSKFLDTVKWYRANCGARNTNWDFTAGFAAVRFEIYTEKEALAVLMWRSKTAKRHDGL